MTLHQILVAITWQKMGGKKWAITHCTTAPEIVEMKVSRECLPGAQEMVHLLVHTF